MSKVNINYKCLLKNTPAVKFRHVECSEKVPMLSKTPGRFISHEEDNVLR